MIYTPIPPDIWRLNQYLKQGGTVVFEEFSKNHLKYREANRKAGRLGHSHFFFSEEEIERDFSNLDIQILEEKEITPNEGFYRKRTVFVTRSVGKKK